MHSADTWPISAIWVLPSFQFQLFIPRIDLRSWTACGDEQGALGGLAPVWRTQTSPHYCKHRADPSFDLVDRICIPCLEGLTDRGRVHYGVVRPTAYFAPDEGVGAFPRLPVYRAKARSSLRKRLRHVAEAYASGNGLLNSAVRQLA